MKSNVKIALTMDDGSVAVMMFCTEGRSPTLPFGAAWYNDGSGLWVRPPTDENIQAELDKAFPGVNQLGIPKSRPVSFALIDDADIPADRTYRNAWELIGKGITHNMEKARAIHLDHVREARTERLGELDRDWMIATAQGDTVAAAAAEAERQVLRDAPATLPVDDAKTVEELKQLWPENLPRK